MKQAIYLIALLGLPFFSCNKRNCSDAIAAKLEGSWRMITVKNNNSGITTNKPSNVQGNVDLTFTAKSDNSGVFFGNTPTNGISESDYTTGTNHLLRIPFLAMTKTAETSWGKEFVDNIRSSEKYSFQSDGKLFITTTHKTLIFERQ